MIFKTRKQDFVLYEATNTSFHVLTVKHSVLKDRPLTPFKLATYGTVMLLIVKQR